jgi:hypothetical protein
MICIYRYLLGVNGTVRCDAPPPCVTVRTLALFWLLSGCPFDRYFFPKEIVLKWEGVGEEGRLVSGLVL